MFRSDWDNTMENGRFVIAFGVSNAGTAWVSHVSNRKDKHFFGSNRGQPEQVFN